MDKTKLKEQVESIRQTFGYMKRFKGETFVIKIDSSLINHDLFAILIKDLTLLHNMGIKIVLVPGARSRINEVLSTFKVQCQTVNGVRISSSEAIPFIKMAAFDVSNRVMTMLAENGANGIIGNWVKARGMGVRNGVDFQNSGIVEKVQSKILNSVLEDGFIPIFPNIGWSGTGKPYNLSSNELAFNLSRELRAAKLFFITNYCGIESKSFNLPKDIYVSEDGIISQLNVDQAGYFVEMNEGEGYNEQLELISLAYNACKQSVKRVHIVDGRVEGMVLQEIFSNVGQGTMVYSNLHENIRNMEIADIPEVLALMQPQIEEKLLVARHASDLEEKVNDYAVYEVDGTIHACGALHLYPTGQGEIAAIVVDKQYASRGIGRKMISYFIDKARNMHLKSVFVLTTQTSDWFLQIGFKEAHKSILPPQKQKTYNERRNSKILDYQLSQKPKINCHVD
ncbi:amino-acid N-acetyltransferase [Chitinispirillales bacterium ANBcel5]|uniref:amino-acid N-acetyltransferase n=1 Tax=Cellulosispirillum alkaliphilum TaxID=3039283 RepID=UPI002A507424|nr:amino-acid N-acetyltransferase [Chitinispirillales bacterium ANBcel5]